MVMKLRLSPATAKSYGLSKGAARVTCPPSATSSPSISCDRRTWVLVRRYFRFDTSKDWMMTGELFWV
ncbi:hypothetical protein D3C72_2562940 [compost metagenome]